MTSSVLTSALLPSCIIAGDCRLWSSWQKFLFSPAPRCSEVRETKVRRLLDSCHFSGFNIWFCLFILTSCRQSPEFTVLGKVHCADWTDLQNKRPVRVNILMALYFCYFVVQKLLALQLSVRWAWILVLTTCWRWNALTRRRKSVLRYAQRVVLPRSYQ